jgi:DNA-damage-inducible protein J
MEEAIPFEVSAKVPNATMIAALNEYEEMKNNPTAYKRYLSFKEAMNEVLDNA